MYKVLSFKFQERERTSTRIVLPIECSLLLFFSFHVVSSVDSIYAINALILLRIIFPVFVSFDWKWLQFFFVHLMFMGHDVCVCVRNNRQMIAYQFDLRKMYIFWSLFASTCNSIRFPRFQCACSRLNSLSHSIRVKSPNIIIIDIGTAARA